MEVLVGPTFTIDVSSAPPAYGSAEHRPGCETEDRAVPVSLFLNEVENRPKNDGPGYARPNFFAGESSESSSSIGTPDDSDIDLSPKRDADLGDEEEEVQSKFNGGAGLGSLDSLEDSLPIKRGLSSHFNGKSKSFTDLSQVTTVNELKKSENPFNKRRRILMASKLSRKSGFYCWSNPKSMPLLPVEEDEDYEEEKARKVPSPLSPSSYSSVEEKKQEEELQKQENNRVAESCASRVRLRLGSFKSRSFSLADLQEHDDEEDDD